MVRKGFLIAIGSMFYCIGACFATEETLTITTYYPSPTGVYQTLRIAPGANPADCIGSSAPLGKMYFNSAENSLYICAAQGGSAGYQLVPGGNGAWAVNGNMLYVLNTTMNVGIGTTTPVAPLVVAGEASAVPAIEGIQMGTNATNDYVALEMAGNAAAGSHIDFTSPGISYKGRIVYHNPDNRLEFWTNSTPSAKMAIDTDGNVGIGTINPTHVLQLTKAHNVQTAASMVRVNFDENWGLRLLQNYTGVGNIQYEWIQRYSGTDYPVMTVKGGHVGIGTSAPEAKLHVVGFGRLDSQNSMSQIKLNVPGTGAANIELRTTDASASAAKPYIDFSNDPVVPYDTRMMLHTDNTFRIFGTNVAIGNIAPARTFYVDGTIGMTSASGGGKTIFDVAEIMPVRGDVDEGDIVVLVPEENRLLARSSKAYDTLVAGVVSSESDEARSRGLLFIGGKKEAEANTGKRHEFVSIAGQVELKVCLENGAIVPGDLLVTSSIPGHAMKGTDRDKMLGTVVAKAMEHFPSDLNPGKEGKGKIIVLMSLQ